MTEVLVGGKCSNCGHLSWPEPNYCSEGCGATIVPVEIENSATVYAATVIDVPHVVFGSSYQLGYADLGSGPRVFGHFESTVPAEIGREVRVALRKFVHPDDSEQSTEAVVFVPAAGRRSA